MPDDKIKILIVDDEAEEVEPSLERVKRDYPISIDKLELVSLFSCDKLEDKDIILVDHHLETKRKGIDIIKMIRDSKCIADILFYSENDDILDLELSGKLNYFPFVKLVHKRKNVPDELIRLIERSDKRANDIVMLRGLILSEVIMLDESVNNLITKFYEPEKENEFLLDVMENPNVSAYAKKTILDHIVERLASGDGKDKLKKLSNRFGEISKQRNKFAHLKEKNGKLVKRGEEVEFTSSQMKKIRRKNKETITEIYNFIRDVLEEE